MFNQTTSDPVMHSVINKVTHLGRFVNLRLLSHNALSDVISFELCSGDPPQRSSSHGSRFRVGLCTGDFQVSYSCPIFFSDFVLILVFCIVANGLEGTQSWGGSCVSVYVEHISSLYLLETSHSCISLVILDHVVVGLSDSDVFCWVLENASCSIGAFTWVL